jgi:hypothetical protein
LKKIYEIKCDGKLVAITGNYEEADKIMSECADKPYKLISLDPIKVEDHITLNDYIVFKGYLYEL